MSGVTFGTPTRAEVIKLAVDKGLRNLAKALPGTVVSYSASSQTCTVRPGVHRLVPSIDDSDVDEVEELPDVQDVPVVWPAGRGFKVKGSLQAGDSVLLVAMDRDMDGWRRSGQPSEPDDARIHSWGSCVAIPGLVPESGSYGTEPTDAAALASKLDLLIGIMKAWVVIPLDGGAALKTLIGAAFPNIPTPTVIPDPPIFVGTTTASSVLLLDEPLLP